MAQTSQLCALLGGALSQAKALGDVLVVGLIPDKEILRCKGPPVLNDEERYQMVESVKWVDEVLTGMAGVQAWRGWALGPATCSSRVPATPSVAFVECASPQWGAEA
jgi:cytidyltransferase-like protein